MSLRSLPLARVVEAIRSPGGRDLLLVAALTSLAMAVFAEPGNTVGIEIPGSVSAGPQPWWAAIVLGLTLPLLGRRRWPGVVLLVVSTVFLVRVATGAGPTAADLAPLVAVDAVAAYGTRRSLLTLPVCAAAQLAVVWAIPALRAETSASVFLVSAVVFLIAPLATGLVRRRVAAFRPGGTARAQDAPNSPVRCAAVPDSSAAPPWVQQAGLTPREREVLTELGRGATNAEIADALGVSPETVKSHVRQVISKLGVRDRTAAALLAPRTDRSWNPA